ncbi:MAG: UDP-N-acetylmuramoyl-L-alanyl-D-glutamate--2,6-diaminopimelate ligase, partial [Propionibacteriaceae bacterium]|nr:UDP-N-acetylmuramoyl-L-alanyl-D-glutamate--2,6-diaminopimelate ligase [Propionibacteriaceae bacterium]
MAESRPSRLADLFPDHAGQVAGVSLDSRRIAPGDLYVALPGARTHGARFAQAAVAQGAVAVLTDAEGAALIGPAAVPVAVVSDLRAVLADLAAETEGHPADRLTMIGVTGTNGKTTTVFGVAALLAALGWDVATIGTMGYRFRDRRQPWATSTITTPEAPHLQAGLRRLAEAGCQAVAMEVSSVALDQHRADGMRFAAVGFTNLGVDHLDYHGDLERYFAAKARLFEPRRAGHAVIHADDPAGRTLIARARAAGVPVTTFGRTPGVDLLVESEVVGPDGSTRVVLAGEGHYEFDLGLPGAHNVTDAALAVALVRAAGFDPAPALPALATLRVPGRVELVALPGAAPRVYVDFAHTPQAVASTLAALRGSAGEGRLIAVVGAGGDRDATKRGAMGAAAMSADAVFVTDDNPRSEDPAAIRAAVLAGAESARATAPNDSVAARAVVLDGGDRRSAIRAALAHADPRDIVAVLGKGHETTQEIAGELTEFADAAVVTQEWAGLGQTGLGLGVSGG